MIGLSVQVSLSDRHQINCRLGFSCFKIPTSSHCFVTHNSHDQALLQMLGIRHPFSEVVMALLRAVPPLHCQKLCQKLRPFPSLPRCSNGFGEGLWFSGASSPTSLLSPRQPVLGLGWYSFPFSHSFRWRKIQSSTCVSGRSSGE